MLASNFKGGVDPREEKADRRVVVADDAEWTVDQAHALRCVDAQELVAGKADGDFRGNTLIRVLDDKGFGFRVWGLGFGVSSLGFRVWGLGFGVFGSRIRVCESFEVSLPSNSVPMDQVSETAS
jgi:hypothetical protein